MLPFIKGFGRSNRKTHAASKEVVPADGAGILRFKDAKQLLEPHMSKVESIYQTLSISREHFKRLYMPVVQNMALIAQEIPASENHHHAYLGGLLEHSLEVAVFAARLRQGVMIRGVSEDQMAIVSEALSYAVITAALLHDVGKACTDVQIANISTNTTYLPLIDTPKVGQKYRFRFRAEREYTDHQKANLQLAIQIMPPDGIRWLSSYTEINQNWSRALAGEYSDAGDIGRIVARADSTSTQRATISQAAAGDSASHNPLSKLTPADAFVRILRTMLENGQEKLPLNKRGAAAWVTNDHIYFVSKRVIDEVKREAERLGPSVSIPSDNSTLMTMLGDAKKIQLNDGKAIHYLMIKEGDWEVPMSMLAFERGLLDPANRLPVTENSLSVRDTGEIIHAPEMQSDTNKDQQSSKTQEPPELPESPESPEESETVKPIEQPQDENITIGGHGVATNHFFASYSESDLPDEPPGLAGIAPPTKNNPEPSRSEQLPPAKVVDTPVVPKEVTEPQTQKGVEERVVTQGKTKATPPTSKKEMGKHFTNWLKNYITLNANKINGVTSTLHIVEPGLLAMVTPAVFSQYLDDNRAMYAEVMSGNNQNTRRAMIKKIQFSVETELSYTRAFNGNKIISLKISGNRHSGTVSGFILNEQSTKEVFGSISIPPYNSHVTIITPLM